MSLQKIDNLINVFVWKFEKTSRKWQRNK